MVHVMGDEESISSWVPLGRLSVFYYGVGHMLNDITSACWFTYLLMFLTDIGLSPRDAAIVMLSGQVADGFATIFAGELIDRFGHFKIWHAAGSILVAISFSSVSHMSMVNCITLDSSSRVVLASCRNAFTMVANLSLYAVALAVFHFRIAVTKLDIEDQYRWIAYVSIFVGCCFVGVFLIGTKEPRSRRGDEGKIHQRIPWDYWFKKVLYYQVALVYMLTRLVTNVSQAFLAFYVINDLQMAQSSKALVPAIIYVCSFVVSIILQEMKWTSSRLKAGFTAGSIMWILSGTGILILPSSLYGFIYLLSVIIGVANALMTVTGISMQSVLVGEDLNGCAFVYGSLSFLDKISCGLALYVLESYQQTSPIIESCNSVMGCVSITRYGLGLVPASCAVIGLVVIYTMDLDRTTISGPLIQPLLA
ncbi:hypothetical protein MKW92_048857 [Papaver armeniacum]|nr:hypothetical protein MKW92_048857 [Papaver armeniacum]